MSLCDTDTKNQIKNMTEYPDIKVELDSMKLLGMVKKLVYTRSKNDLNNSHNRAITPLNLLNLHQDRFQYIQVFQDQSIAIKKVCSELGPKFGRCKEHESNTEG